MLWFKFIFGFMVFELVSILFAIFPDYGNEYTTEENKNWASFKIFAPKLNLNHNIYGYPGFVYYNHRNFAKNAHKYNVSVPCLYQNKIKFGLRM